MLKWPYMFPPEFIIGQLRSQYKKKKSLCRTQDPQGSILSDKKCRETQITVKFWKELQMTSKLIYKNLKEGT